MVGAPGPRLGGERVALSALSTEFVSHPREDQEKKPWDHEPPQQKPLTSWKGEFLMGEGRREWGRKVKRHDGKLRRQKPQGLESASSCLSRDICPNPSSSRCPSDGGCDPHPGCPAVEWVGTSCVRWAANSNRVWGSTEAGQGMYCVWLSRLVRHPQAQPHGSCS